MSEFVDSDLTPSATHAPPTSVKEVTPMIQDDIQASGDTDATAEEQNGMNYQDWSGVDVMESLCMSCGENGLTRMMLHKIPYFREIILASFACEHCGEHNNEVTFGGEIQLQGCEFELTVTCDKDLDRQLIKSDSASVRLKELEFEIPPMTQRGGISTIEGMLSTAAKNLALHQRERMQQMPDVGVKVAQVIGRLHLICNRSERDPDAEPDSDVFPFTLVVDDPAGNSFVENPHAPLHDPHMRERHYTRTAEQDMSLGLQPGKGTYRDDKESNFGALLQHGGKQFGQLKASSSAEPVKAAGPAVAEGRAEAEGTQDTALVSAPGGAMGSEEPQEEEVNRMLDGHEVVVIPTLCPHCGRMGENRTAVTSIPHFKEVIILAFECPECGFRESEVKGGGGVPTYGTEVRLTLTHEEDFKRDLLKSDTAGVAIPALDLELEHGTLGGMFTTVEGLLNAIARRLRECNPFAVGDSSVLHHATVTASGAESEAVRTKRTFEAFMQRLESFAAGKPEELPFVLVLRDPLGNSFISPRLGTSLPPEMDAGLELLDFERTFQENEDLGLNDINTGDEEAYAKEDAAAAAATASAGPVTACGKAPVLSDRLRYQHRQGPDHPTPFAMGTTEGDHTQGGMYFQSSVPASAGGGGAGAGEESGEGEYLQPPAGYRAARPDELDGAPHPHAAPALHSIQEQQGEEEQEGQDGDNGDMAGTDGVATEGGEGASRAATTGASSSGGGSGGAYVSRLGRRHLFSEADLELEFDPREEFAGCRPGFVFRLGAQGIGYYRDKGPFGNYGGGGGDKRAEGSEGKYGVSVEHS